jgi:hypothetical protein
MSNVTGDPPTSTSRLFRIVTTHFPLLLRRHAVVASTTLSGTLRYLMQEAVAERFLTLVSLLGAFMLWKRITNIRPQVYGLY